MRVGLQMHVAIEVVPAGKRKKGGGAGGCRRDGEWEEHHHGVGRSRGGAPASRARCTDHARRTHRHSITCTTAPHAHADSHADTHARHAGTHTGRHTRTHTHTPTHTQGTGTRGLFTAGARLHHPPPPAANTGRNPSSSSGRAGVARHERRPAPSPAQLRSVTQGTAPGHTGRGRARATTGYQTQHAGSEQQPVWRPTAQQGRQRWHPRRQRAPRRPRAP